MDALSFAGSTAVVTGAAQGIGHGIATLLADLGARVIAVDRDGAALAANLPRDRFDHRVTDLATTDVLSLADDMWGSAGPLDLVVNNVGIDTPHGFLDLELPDYDRVFATNLRAPWFLTRRLVEHALAEGRTPAIVFVSSLHDTFIRGLPHYSASKAAVSMLVREMAQELAPRGIRVNAIAPGIVQSGHVPPPDSAEADAEIRRIVPLGRIGRPQDVAQMAAVLLSDVWSGYVTGTTVRVDGGLGLHSWSVDRR